MRLNRTRSLLLLGGVGLLTAVLLAYRPPVAPAIQVKAASSEAAAPRTVVPVTPDIAAPRSAPAEAADTEIAPMRALADEGARLFAARRFTEAAEKLLPAAEAGYPQAQYQVGWMNYLGFGLPKDLEQAVTWFRRAAAKGNLDGMNALGTALREGKGTELNQAEALRWYQAAADQAHADGEVNLGFMHEMGYATEKDPAAAARYYRLAAEQNHATAQFYLASLFEEGKGVPRDLDTARGWYRRAAAQGNEYARLALQRLDGQANATVPNPAVNWAGER